VRVRNDGRPDVHALGSVLMRALIVLLLLLASLASARETIVSGDSDHTILPPSDIASDHSREVLLFKTSMYAQTSTSPDTRWYSFWTNGVPPNSYLRCLPMRGHDADLISPNPGDCTDPTHKWTTNRNVTITRASVVLHKPWFYRPGSQGGAGGTWNDCRFRFVSIANDGTITPITPERQWPVDAQDEDGYFQLSLKLQEGEGVGVQLRRPGEITGIVACIVEDLDSQSGMLGEIQLWGVYN